MNGEGREEPGGSVRDIEGKPRQSLAFPKNRSTAKAAKKDGAAKVLWSFLAVRADPGRLGWMQPQTAGGAV